MRMSDCWESVLWVPILILLPYVTVRLLATMGEVVRVCRKQPLENRYFLDTLLYIIVWQAAESAFQTEYPLSEKVRAVVLLACTVGVICDILRRVVLRHNEWRARQMKLIHGLFGFLDRFRTRAERYANVTMGLAAAAALIAFLAKWRGWHMDCVAIFGMVAVLSGLMFFLLSGRSSCRSLILLWLAGGFMVFFILFKLVNMAGGALGYDLIGDYCFFTVVYAAFWCFGIGIADDDAGKLAALTVNTVTTMLSIAFSLLALYGNTAYPDNGWERLQLMTVYGLLPLVIAGYSAALFKEAQIYWHKKYAGKREIPHQAEKEI